MKTWILSSLVLIAAATASAAPVATLHVHSGVGTPGVFAETMAPAAGSWACFGVLDSAFNPEEAGWNPSALASAWTEFGAVQMRSHRDGSGRFSASLHSERADFAGKPVHLWIVQTSDGAKPLADASNVVAHALLGSSSKAWRFPTPGALAPANAVVLSTSEVDSAWFGMRVAGAVKLERSGLSYARWAGAAFDPAQTDLDASWTADPDGDGVVNLLEYVFGSKPGERKSSHFISVRQESEGQYLEAEFDAAPWRSDAQPVAEVSGDLVTWVPLEAKVISRQADGTERRVARDTQPVGGDGQRFIRVRAAQP